MTPNQVDLEAEEIHGAAGVSVATRPSAQLVVPAPCVIAARPDDAEPAQGRDPVTIVALWPAEADIGSAPGHLGGDGDRSERSGLGDDAGFLGVVLSVENGRVHPFALEEGRQTLGLGDVHRADQNRPSARVDLSGVGRQRVVLRRTTRVEAVRLVPADTGPIGRYLGDLELVEFA